MRPSDRKKWIAIGKRAVIGALSVISVGCVQTGQFKTMELANEDLRHFYAEKHLKLSSCNIQERLVVNGRLDAASSRISNLLVNGNAHIDNTTIYGEAKVNGGLEFSASSIKGPLDLNGNLNATHGYISKTTKMTGNLAVLDHSELDHLYMENGSFSTLDLRNGTVIHGNVVFVGAPGKILIDQTSRIKGQILQDVKGGNRVEIGVSGK